MKMPATAPAGEGWDGEVLEKIFLYGKATDGIEEAFSHFAAIWSDEAAKEKEITDIQRWIESDLA